MSFSSIRAGPGFETRRVHTQIPGSYDPGIFTYFYIMIISQKQLQEAIMKVAVYIREDRSYEELLKISTLPEICKKIAYDLFIRNVTESNAMNDTDVFTSIVMIRKYCQGLARVGFFDFKSDISGHAGL